MLVKTGENTAHAGPFDVMFIYHNVAAGTYHAVLYEERSMPGPVPAHDQQEVIRLKSSMHHTEGSPTFEGAVNDVARFRESVKLDDLNVNVTNPVPWNGELGDVMFVPNWRLSGRERHFDPMLSL